MARIGFLMLPGYGHVLPSLALAKALRSRGHDIVYYNTEHFRDLVERAGAALHALRPRPRSARTSAFGRYGRILDNFRRMVDLTIEELPEAVRRDDVAVLVVDQSIVSGRTVAELAGVPFVTLCAGSPHRRDGAGRLAPLFASWAPAESRAARLRNRLAFAVVDAASRPLLRHLNRSRRARGLPVHRRLDDTFSEAACVCQLPEAFEPAGVEASRRFHFVGPLVDVAAAEAGEPASVVPFPAGRLDGRPVLYICFGTAAPLPPNVYQTVLAGSAGLGFLRVVSTGGRALLPELKALEDDETVVVAFAPQLAILRQASVVVTHGGLNTTLESLIYGRPLLVMPICDDQPGVAARVARAGAALVVPAKRASPARVRSALERLRDDPGYRRRAEAVASMLAARGGARRAAEIVEELIPRAPA